MENPGDRGAWWASVYGVAQSWTQLKPLSSSSSSSSSSRIDWLDLLAFQGTLKSLSNTTVQKCSAFFMVQLSHPYVTWKIITLMIWTFVSKVTEKAIATHSSTLAWKMPWTEEPGRLESMGSLRVSHDWVTSLSLFTFMHWKRKWKPTPVFLPRESQGRRSLVGCHL